MKKFILGCFLLSSSYNYAENIELDNLSQSDVDSISEEFSANFVHTTVSGASTMGSIFGFEVGIIGRATDTPKIGALVKEQSPNTDIGSIYDAGIMAQVSVPFGITGELVFLPEIDLGEFKAKKQSIGLKWTITDGLLVLPFNLAVRAHYSSADFSYADVINNSSTGNINVNSEIGIETSSFGAHVTASLDLMVVEPYAGMGFVSSDTDINVNAAGSASIFSYTAAQSASSSSSGLHYFVGAQANLLLFKFAAEYSNVYGVDRVTGKFALGF